MIFNPDFEALNAFVENDVKNGAKVWIVGVSGTYTWRDGKVVDKDGKVVMDCLKKRKGDKK